MSFPQDIKRHESNPYPSEFALLLWHDIWKHKVEEHNDQWREQSAWVNANIPEHRTDFITREQPWRAMQRAVEAQQQKIKELESRLCTS